MKSKPGKMKMLKSISADRALKNMIFVILYVSGILAFFSYVLWPTILDFKAEYVVERKHKIVYNEVKKGFNASKDRLDSFIKENKNLLKRINSTNQLEIIQNASKKHFSKFTIKKISEQTNSQTKIKTTIYKISAQSQSLKNLWDFISELNKASSSIVINIPISIQKPDKAKYYDIVFNVDSVQNVDVIDPTIKEILEK